LRIDRGSGETASSATAVREWHYQRRRRVDLSLIGRSATVTKAAAAATASVAAAEPWRTIRRTTRVRTPSGPVTPTPLSPRNYGAERALSRKRMFTWLRITALCHDSSNNPLFAAIARTSYGKCGYSMLIIHNHYST